MEKIVTNSNAEYHSGEGVSKSDLDNINKCPAIYRYYKENPSEETAALLFGTAVHKLILEPDKFYEEYAIEPICDKRTKEGKAVYSQWLDENKGKAVISQQDYEIAAAMRTAVESNPRAAMLLNGGTTETSYYWIDAETEEICKCRPDKFNHGYIIDLKTTADASPDGFSKSAYAYRYHVQAAWYIDGIRTVTNEEPKGFVFIAVEKKPPYAVGIYICDEMMIDLGRKDARRNLLELHECKIRDTWYGYGGESEKIMPISLSAWAAKNGGIK